MHKVKLVNKHVFYYLKMLCDSNIEKYLFGWRKIADLGFLSFRKENLQFC